MLNNEPPMNSIVKDQVINELLQRTGKSGRMKVGNFCRLRWCRDSVQEVTSPRLGIEECWNRNRNLRSRPSGDYCRPTGRKPTGTATRYPKISCSTEKPTPSGQPTQWKSKPRQLTNYEQIIPRLISFIANFTCNHNLDRIKKLGATYCTSGSLLLEYVIHYHIH